VTWFKVDDSFHSHPKVLAVDAGALGLWVIAGSWCSANLTDGFVPNHVLPRILPDSAGHADTLVSAGLWTREKTGYRFHDWHDFQPTADEVNEERRAARERMRALRSKRRENQESAGQAADCSGEHVANVRENFAEVPNPDPTRPDPTKDKEHPSDVLFGDTPAEPAKPKKRAQPATRIPDDFTVTKDMVAWAGRETPLVNGKWETDQFIDYWKAADGRTSRKKDWNAAWRTWMRKAQKDAEARQPCVPVQQPRQSGLPARYEPRSVNARADRQYPPSQSSEGRNYDGWTQDVKAQILAEMANGGTR
jgi:hypothetical protein